MTIENLVKQIQDETEWLHTTTGDEIECISLENLETLLSNYFKFKIKITQK